MIVPCVILIVILTITAMIIYICSKKFEIFTVVKGLYLLRTITSLLRKHKIKTWLDAGTLLGVIRDKELIEHDSDVDIATYYDNRERLLQISENVGLLESMKLECWRTEDNIISFNIIGDKNTYLDVYLMKWKPKVQPIVFKNFVYNVPKDPESYLKILYGDWKTPRKGKHADANVHLKGRGVKADKAYFDKNVESWDYNIL